MKTHEGPWRPMKAHEDPWRPMKTHEDPWRPMKTHEDTWKHMKIHEKQKNLWKTVIFFPRWLLWAQNPQKNWKPSNGQDLCSA